MGIIQKVLFCGWKTKSKLNWKTSYFIQDSNLTKYIAKSKVSKEQENRDDIDISTLPDDEFLCSECGLVPEILSIEPYTGNITFECKNDGIKPLNINKYYDSLSNSIFSYSYQKCVKCKHYEKTLKKTGIIMKYCLKCERPICNRCIDYFHMEHQPFCINLNEKNNNCSIHPNEKANTYCYDCDKIICKADKNHDTHHKINTDYMQKNVDEYKKSIIEKNKVLFKVLKFYRLIISCGNEGIQNQLAKLIEEEKTKDKYLVDLAIYQNELNREKNKKNRPDTETKVNINI